MSAQTVSTLLQNGATPLRDQRNVLDKQILAQNESLTSEITRLKLRVLELEHAADTDPLLPVYNRRAFVREIGRAQTVMARYDILSTVIFFDLNGFKAINDRFGHAIGDELLLKIGQVMQAGVRDCDMVARLGGDEFGMLLFKTNPEIAHAKAKTILCRIADQAVLMPTGAIKVSAAYGVSPCEADDTPEQILDRADRAMYIAKKRQKDAKA